jgi:hypothetical protein
MWTDRRDEPPGLLGGHVVIAGVLTEQSRRRDDAWALEGGTNFALVHAALQGPRIVPTPRVLCECARNGHIAAEEARRLITTISPHRNWENSPYVTQLLADLE